MYPKEEMKDIEDEVENFVGGKFDPMEEKQEDPIMGTVGEGEIWQCLKQQEENLLNVDMDDDPSLFFNDFPPLHDFQCMSSSSVNSSSAASMDDAFSQSVGGLDIDCMEVMERFGLDTTGIWDPSSIFCDEIDNPQKFQQILHSDQEQQVKDSSEEKSPVGELRAMFFEWLKNNKDVISADEVRSIKINRNTIESAWNRLGSTQEGRKHLLQLILQWVLQNQLHKRANTQFGSFPQFQIQNHPNFSPNSHFDPNACLPQLPPPPFYNNSPPNLEININNTNNSGQSWVPIPYNPYMENPNLQSGGIYGDQYPYPSDGERLMRQGNSATREARKKRMARQKRIVALNRNVNNHNHNHNHNQNQGEEENTGFVNGGDKMVICSSRGVSACVYPSQNVSIINHISPQSIPIMPVMEPVHSVPVDQPPPVMHAPKCNRQVPSEKRQGFKPEKSLKFLLQKVLKQSDVGNLGRIVLPKREAETHLPKLEARDGIPIAMEDIGTSRVWNLRYRFWPNNKSRMYLLENTGDFVRANGLQAEDFIVIYLDVKSGKYLIRGVKVRPLGQKSESRKPARRNQRGSAKAGNRSSSSPTKEMV